MYMRESDSPDICISVVSRANEGVAEERTFNFNMPRPSLMGKGSGGGGKCLFQFSVFSTCSVGDLQFDYLAHQYTLDHLRASLALFEKEP